MHIHSKKVQLWMTNHLLEALDEAAKRRYQTRSEYIRRAIVMRLNEERIVKNEAAQAEALSDNEWEKIIDASKRSLDE